jgi:flagellar biosynthesis GTPase FlhF
VRVKTFKGKTLEELLPEIRQELGPDAVVLGQRQVVEGGVGGFFGTRMVQVTAADRMPDDTELVDLEDRFMGGEQIDDQIQTSPLITTAAPVAAPTGVAHAAAATAYSSTTGGLLDVRDDWDPGADPDVALQIVDSRNTVAAAAMNLAATMQPAGDFEPVEMPTRTATIDVTDEDDVEADAALQARRLAARAHQAIADATKEIERQLATSTPVERPSATSTFRAEVVEPTPRTLDDQRVEAAPSATDISTDISNTPALIADELVGHGVDRDVADVLVQTAVNHRQPLLPERELRTIVRDLVAESIPARSGWPAVGRAQRIAFVGPSGAGTSSMVAKVAERYAAAGLRVGVISVIAGTAHGALAHANDPLLRRGGLDIQFAADVDQALTAVERLADRDLIVIDTPSTACHDTAANSAVSACLAAMRADDVVLTLPLATSVREASAAIERFNAVPVTRLAITKLDESNYDGQLLNFGFRLNVPITLLSEGPNVPDHLRAASSQDMAERLLPPTTTST